MVQKILIILFFIIAKTNAYSQNYSSDSLAYAMASRNFEIDTSLTGFKLASILDGSYVYTPNGRSDLQGDKETSGFVILVLPDITFNDGVNFVKQSVSDYSSRGLKVDKLQIIDTLIGGNKIYECTFEFSEDSGNTKYVLVGFVQKDSKSRAFMATDIDNGIFTKRFKDTFRKMKF